MKIFDFCFSIRGSTGAVWGVPRAAQEWKNDEKNMFYDEKKSGIRKEIKIPYFGDQKYDV